MSSALDIQNTSLATFNQSYIFPVNGQSGSTTAKYIAQEEFTGAVNGASIPLYNLTHTDFTKRNSQWIYSEMQNSLFNDCAAACSNLLTITGNEPVCPTSSFSINQPPGASVIWDVNPQNIAVVDPSTGVVTRVSNGSATLTATVSSCGFSVPVSKTIQVGSPTPSFTYNTSYLGGGTTAKYLSASATQLSGTLPGDYTWTLSPNNANPVTTFTGLSFSDYRIPDCTGLPFTLKVNTSCGIAQNGATVYNELGCYRGFSISPNPASSSITVTYNGSKQTNNNNAANTEKGLNNKTVKGFKIIQIIDKTGLFKKQVEYKAETQSATIDISNLPSDTYVVRIFNGSTWEDHKIIIVK